MGVRGPVSIHQAVSVSPVEIESVQITKSVNGEVELNEDSTEKDSKKSSDTMAMKHFVRFGLYQIKGSVNVQLAERRRLRIRVQVLCKCIYAQKKFGGINASHPAWGE